jgi:hypothetical protein
MTAGQQSGLTKTCVRTELHKRHWCTILKPKATLPADKQASAGRNRHACLDWQCNELGSAAATKRACKCRRFEIPVAKLVGLAPWQMPKRKSEEGRRRRHELAAVREQRACWAAPPAACLVCMMRAATGFQDLHPEATATLWQRRLAGGR